MTPCAKHYDGIRKAKPINIVYREFVHYKLHKWMSRSHHEETIGYPHWSSCRSDKFKLPQRLQWTSAFKVKIEEYAYHTLLVYQELELN